MRKLYRGVAIAVAALSLFSAKSGKAFSLLGPYTDWMTQTNGYRSLADIGGPMSLNAEYRWNVPVVTYAFDQSFLNYFGTNGITAVENAIAVLNNLPPASQLNPSNFPLSTIRVNFPAQAQSLVDLKSTTMFLLLEQMGLAKPSRFTAAVHSFSETGGIVDGVVVQRNFDPFSLTATNGVNGVQYGYALFLTHTNPDSVNWYVYPLDPQSPAWTGVADGDPTQVSDRGFFFTGLTRDDVGGLRYLLSTNNYNLEHLLPDVHGTGTNAGNYVDAAIRAGVDKITFVRQDYDFLAGVALVPLTNHFVDAYMTNNVIVHQQLERVISKPDIIFSAFSDPSNTVALKRTGTTNWLNESSGNLDGPGIIRPQITIAFRKFGLNASVETADGFSYASTESSRWASFDESANPPVIFPIDSAAGQVTDFQVNVFLNGLNIATPSFAWHLPVAFGETAVLQTSTNLLNWTSLGTVTNYGMPLDWSHFCTAPQNFFRAIPQPVSP